MLLFFVKTYGSHYKEAEEPHAGWEPWVANPCTGQSKKPITVTHFIRISLQNCHMSLEMLCILRDGSRVWVNPWVPALNWISGVGQVRSEKMLITDWAGQVFYILFYFWFLPKHTLSDLSKCSRSFFGIMNPF